MAQLNPEINTVYSRTDVAILAPPFPMINKIFGLKFKIIGVTSSWIDAEFLEFPSVEGIGHMKSFQIRRSDFTDKHFLVH